MTITLRSIKFFGFHGVYENERNEGNDFEVDVTINIENAEAIYTDKLSDTVDYTLVNDSILQVSQSKQYLTLESFCYDICKAILMLSERINLVTVELKKLHPPSMNNVESVGVLFTLST